MWILLLFFFNCLLRWFCQITLGYFNHLSTLANYLKCYSLLFAKYLKVVYHF